MKVNIDLDKLVLFREPHSVFDLANHQPNHYGSSHALMKKMVSQDLIRLHSQIQTCKNATKKLYVVTARGKALLSLFAPP